MHIALSAPLFIVIIVGVSLLISGALTGTGLHLTHRHLKKKKRAEDAKAEIELKQDLAQNEAIVLLADKIGLGGSEPVVELKKWNAIDAETIRRANLKQHADRVHKPSEKDVEKASRFGH